MASDEARITSAYIEVKVRKARDFDADARRMGHEAGQEYEKAFEASASRTSAGARARHAAEGRRIGSEVGDAAGREAGQRTATGITEGLARTRGRRVRDGESVGAAIGVGATRTFRAKFVGGIKSTSNLAGKILESGVYQGLNRGFRRGLLGAAAIGALSASASSLGSILAGTVAAVAQLSGVLAVLPAVGVAAGIGLAAVKIGVHDIGDALSDSGDPKKYAEALKKLSPAAQSFTKAVVKLKPELKALRNSVQQGLFKGLAREVTDLGARYIPILSKGLTDVAKGFNFAARDVGKFLDKASTARQVSGIFDNVAKAGQQLAPAFRPAVAALLDIVDVGATFLPNFANKVTDLSKRFEVFIAKSKDSGALKDFIQGGIDGFKQLGGALGQAGRIIGGIFKAGGNANTSPLETFSNVLKSIADTVNTPAFQAGLSNFFDAIAVAGEGVADKMSDLGDALVALEPTFSRIIEGSGLALPSILENIAVAATSAAPVLNALGAAFVAIAPHAGPLVIALIGLKVAMFGIAKATAVLEAITVLRGRILVLGEAALATRIRMLGLAASLRTVGLASLAARVEVLAATSALKLLGAASVVVGTAFAAVKLSEYVGKANVATVSTDKLAESFRNLGSGQGLGGEALKLFSSGMGPFRRDAEDGAQALDRFGISAYNALDQGWDARLRRFQEFGGVQARFKEQATQVDAALTKLAQNGGLEEAGRSYSDFLKAAVDQGVPLAVIQAQFPKFNAAVAASGKSVDGTTGKVQELTRSLESLISTSDEYANKQLDANNAARGYQSALNAVRDAAKEGGKGIDITTEAGYRNSEALDTLAQRGIALAKATAGDGSNAQAKFRASLLQTRGDLVKAGIRLGLTRQAARDYASSLLKIPSKASTRITTPGIESAIRKLGSLIVQANRINGKTYSYTIRQVFESVGRQDDAEARRGPGGRGMTGGFVGANGAIRRADGGLIDPRLGAPRQDNVPLLVSGGEFVVNAFATSQPGVLALLRKINSSNQLPQKLASGGHVRRASAGLNDLSASAPARIQRMEAARQAPQPVATAGVSREDLDYFASRIEKAMRGISVRLDSGAIAGAVEREGGRRW